MFDEIAVFQGASYFRGVSKGQVYGLSARGLAIDTAQPGGEEFPFFRAFWLETPVPTARQTIVHALLDSPSATGAYTFRIAGGKPTTMDVEVKLFTRKQIEHVGVAPLTSMFLFSGNGRERIDDFRPAVHDSDGLAIADANGERVWRPLANPRRLQVSAFSVKELAGFGLIQRQRNFPSFEDLEARYERRPSAWVEPVGSWGSGAVHLVEIPSEEEIHDNVVAFWRPQEPYKQGSAYTFAYRLTWPDQAPPAAGAQGGRAADIVGPRQRAWAQERRGALCRRLWRAGAAQAARSTGGGLERQRRQDQRASRRAEPSHGRRAR